MKLKGKMIAVTPRVKRMLPGQPAFEPSVQLVLPHSPGRAEDGSPTLSPELTSVAQIDYWTRVLKMEIDNAADSAKRKLELAGAETKALCALQHSVGSRQLHTAHDLHPRGSNHGA